jgi:hypothetical protein
MTASLRLLLPGDPLTATGGYRYDRRIVAALRDLGWHVEVVSLDDSFPSPTPAAHGATRAQLAAIPDGALTMIDGLALGAMPDEALAESQRLALIALVHHPLAAETGLSEARARVLRDSETRALRAVRAVITTSTATAAMLRADYAVPARTTAHHRTRRRPRRCAAADPAGNRPPPPRARRCSCCASARSHRARATTCCCVHSRPSAVPTGTCTASAVSIVTAPKRRDCCRCATRSAWHSE